MLETTGDAVTGSVSALDVALKDEDLAMCSRKAGSKVRGERGDTGGPALVILPCRGPVAEAARRIVLYNSDCLVPSIPVFGPFV